jgi:hypothetical protein
VTVNNVQIFGAMAEGIEVVTQLMLRYALFETVYFRDADGVKVQELIKPPLVKLYAAVLRYLAKAKLYYDRSTGRELPRTEPLKLY